MGNGRFLVEMTSCALTCSLMMSAATIGGLGCGGGRHGSGPATQNQAAERTIDVSPRHPSLPQNDTSEPPRSSTKSLLFSTRPWPLGPGAQMSKERERVLLQTLFPRFLDDPAGCSGKGAPLAKARDAGEFVPRVWDLREGPFTNPRQSELLVLVHMGECEASHVENFGSRRLVVMSGDRVLLDKEVAATTIQTTRDVDLDGTLEVVLGNSYMGHGVLVASSRVVSLTGAAVTEIRDLGPVLEDTCGSMFPKNRDTATVYVEPGTPPRFHIEKHTEACPPKPTRE